MKSESVSVLLAHYQPTRTHTRLTQMIYEEFHSAPVKPDLAWGVNTRKSTVSSLRTASCRREWLLSARKRETLSRVAITLTSPLRACYSRPAFHEPWITRCSISKCKYLDLVSPRSLAEELFQKVKRLFGDPHQATEDLKAEVIHAFNLLVFRFCRLGPFLITSNQCFSFF